MAVSPKVSLTSTFTNQFFFLGQTYRVVVPLLLPQPPKGWNFPLISSVQPFPFHRHIVPWLTLPSQVPCGLQNSCSLVRKCPYILNYFSGTLCLDDTIFFTTLLNGSCSFSHSSSVSKLASAARMLFNTILFLILECTCHWVVYQLSSLA